MKAELNDNTITWIKNCSVLKVESLRIWNLKRHVILSSSRNGNIPESRVIYLDSGNSFENIINIWRYGCTTVELLFLENFSLSNLNFSSISTVIPYVHWPILVDLHVKINEAARPNGFWNSIEHRNHLTSVTEVFKLLNVPSIKNIYLHVECGFLDALQRHPLPGLYKEFLAFLVRHKSSLVGLNTHLRGKCFADLLQNIKSDALKSLSLQTLSLNFDVDHAQMSMHLSLGGNNLKTLILDKNFWIRQIFLDLRINFLGTIQRNCNTLETLIIRRMSLDCSWLDGCKSLKHLKLLVWNPYNIIDRCHLPLLTKLHLTIYLVQNNENAEQSETLRDQLLGWIERCMKNLEEMHLLFYSEARFTIHHYNSILFHLSKLRDLKLSKVDSEQFEIFKSENKATTSINYSIEVTESGLVNSFHTFQMQRSI